MSRRIFLVGHMKRLLRFIVKALLYVCSIIYTSFFSLTILVLVISQFCRLESFGKVFKKKLNMQRILPIMLLYPIKDQISSPTTKIVFTDSKLTNIPICIKVWQRQRIKEDRAKQIFYLLEGFNYNQRSAPGVYLGIAYLEGLNKDMQTFRRGFLTVMPRKSKLKNGEYAIVMRDLNRDWRLDNRLYSEREPLASQDGMQFLVKGIARLHKQAKSSPRKWGIPESIAKKLEFNTRFFEQAVAKLSQSDIDMNAYRQISCLLQCAVIYLKPDFQQRYNQGHIKRCHGDLKLTNLWVRPISKRYPQQQLLALDCIDFNPDFYHIDTLSDVAMFVMDLHMHLTQKDSFLVEVFIDAYINEMAEDKKSVKPLLKYYIVEKAMVCGNVSILLDNAPERGKQYFLLALQQAEELQRLLPLSEEQVLPTVEKTELLTRH